MEGEKVEAVTNFFFLGSKITEAHDCSHKIRRWLLLGRKAMTNLDSVEKQWHYSANKGLSSRGYGLSSGHIQLWELDRKEGRPPKNWCLWTVVLEKTSQSPPDSKELKPVNLKGNEPWIFIGRTDAEAEAPILWPPDAKSQFTGKRPWCWERLKARGEGGDRGWDGWMWYHQLNGYEFEQTPGDSEGQGSLASCSPWGGK